MKGVAQEQYNQGNQTKKKNNKMVGLYPNIMVISLDVNGLNTQITRQDYVVVIIYVVCKIKQCNPSY